MPLYLSEISTKETASILGVLLPFGIVPGVFTGQILQMEAILGTEDHWNILLAITAVPALISASIWFFIPESPRYLFVMRHNATAAVQELCRLRKKSPRELQNEIDIMRQEITEMERLGSTDENVDWTIGSIWATEDLRTRFLCVLMLHSVNQLCGINAVVFYSTSIFQSAGLSKQQAEFALLGIGLVNVTMTGMGGFLIGRFRRRILMFTSMISACVLLVIQIVIINNIDAAAWLPYACIAAIILFVVSYGVGIANIPFFLPTELIPAGPRPLVMSVGCMVNWIMNFSVGMFFPIMQSAIGAYSFAIFATVIGILFVPLFYLLPETKLN